MWPRPLRLIGPLPKWPISWVASTSWSTTPALSARTRRSETLAEDDWDRVLDINLKGTFLCSQAALRYMLPQQRGVICSLASISGKEGNANMAPYSVSKAGVICFTKTLAKEVLDCGIRVNCVAPALINTPILQGMDQDRVDFLTAKIPLGRLGRPEEVAATILFLVSDESTFATGQCFDVSGGRATY